MCILTAYASVPPTASLNITFLVSSVIILTLVETIHHVERHSGYIFFFQIFLVLFSNYFHVILIFKLAFVILLSKQYYFIFFQTFLLDFAYF